MSLLNNLYSIVFPAYDNGYCEVCTGTQRSFPFYTYYLKINLCYLEWQHAPISQGSIWETEAGRMPELQASTVCMVNSRSASMTY